MGGVVLFRDVTLEARSFSSSLVVEIILTLCSVLEESCSLLRIRRQRLGRSAALGGLEEGVRAEEEPVREDGREYSRGYQYVVST